MGQENYTYKQASVFACCKKCTERKVTEDYNCHTYCQQYKDAQEVQRQKREFINKLHKDSYEERLHNSHDKRKNRH